MKEVQKDLLMQKRSLFLSLVLLMSFVQCSTVLSMEGGPFCGDDYYESMHQERERQTRYREEELRREQERELQKNKRERLEKKRSDLYNAMIQKFATEVIEYFQEVVIPQYATELAKPNHKITVVLDLDDTLFANAYRGIKRRSKKNLADHFYANEQMRSVVRRFMDWGFKIAINSGRVDGINQSEPTRENISISKLNLEEEGFFTAEELLSIPLMLMPLEKKMDILRTCTESHGCEIKNVCSCEWFFEQYALFKESSRAQLVHDGATIVATIDDEFLYLYNKEKELRAHTGNPFLIPHFDSCIVT